MTLSPPPGLRERKRLATRRAIQMAVLRLVVERGLENVTIDDISTAADVSPRTFFNYFTSKEAAIVGDGPEMPDEEALDRFVHGGGAAGNLLSEIGALMAETAGHASDDAESLLLRRQLHKQYPQLSTLRMIGMREFEKEIIEIVARRIVVDQPELAADPEALDSRAKLATFVAVGAMRHAWMSWADGDTKEPLADKMRDSFRQLDHLVSVSA